MQQIVRWLMDVEHLANDSYSRAAEYLKEDKELNSFLMAIAEDEAWHYHLMTSAAEHLRSLPSETPIISVDAETKIKVEGALAAIPEKIESGSLTKDFLMDSIANAEFSEWNDIFLYVIDTLKISDKEFMDGAIGIQRHKRSIEHFYENIEGGHSKIQRLKAVAPVWQENILIAEDNEVNSKLIKTILNNEGNIDTAYNGKEGLDKLRNKYYNLIISDIDMPIMDGLQFFTEASKVFPDISSRFLFISADISAERRSFFKKHNLRYLEKPAPVNEIRNNALKIILDKGN